MSLAYILDGGMNDQPGSGAEMYERYPAMRKVYEDVRDWTGYSPDQVLYEERPEGQFYRHGIGPIRQAAAVIGISDVLAEHGVTPALICGLSSGGLTAACLAGAIDRKDFFTLLCRMRDAPRPDPDAPPEAVAVLFIPEHEDPVDFLHERSADVYLGTDCGVVAPNLRMILASGYRHDLEELATRVPKKAFQFVEGHSEAFHTPLLQYLSDYIEPFVAQVQFHDATIPVNAGTAPETVTKAAKFAELFVRNTVTSAHVPYMEHGLTEHGATLGLIVGPSKQGVYANPTIPLVHVDTPDHIVEALTAIHELDVPLPA
jgi:[acyl-carrier-protein] S-malonyltransferase